MYPGKVSVMVRFLNYNSSIIPNVSLKVAKWNGIVLSAQPAWGAGEECWELLNS